MITLRTDTVSRKKRSQIMSAVRSTGNKATEAVFITILRKGGISGWRRKFRLRGKPDFVFPKQKTAIFVDGCFWHGCTKHCRMPKGNSGYWKPKISRNKARDRVVTRDLRRAGWRVVRVWEHELSPRHQKRLSQRILQALQ
jgi:DNA mismatch endonuclease (patch repair protein)